MRVMDFTGRATATLEIEFSLPAELLNTAFAYTWTGARDTLEVDPSWFDEVRTSAPERLTFEPHRTRRDPPPACRGLRSRCRRRRCSAAPLAGRIRSRAWPSPAR